MDNGQWTMDNSQWTMDNGQWTIVRSSGQCLARRLLLSHHVLLSRALKRNETQ
ncbi:MAG: hypothetical protein LBB49_00165 [Gracilibacteraceae bacterium]|nr:hypothetical protein [Gracilibacteraceae bacterium]